jgi:hypothetical protein
MVPLRSLHNNLGMQLEQLDLLFLGLTIVAFQTPYTALLFLYSSYFAWEALVIINPADRLVTVGFAVQLPRQL